MCVTINELSLRGETVWNWLFPLLGLANFIVQPGRICPPDHLNEKKIIFLSRSSKVLLYLNRNKFPSAPFLQLQTKVCLFRIPTKLISTWDTSTQKIGRRVDENIARHWCHNRWPNNTSAEIVIPITVRHEWMLYGTYWYRYHLSCAQVTPWKAIGAHLHVLFLTSSLSSIHLYSYILIFFQWSIKYCRLSLCCLLQTVPFAKVMLSFLPPHLVS